jgi:hypothetical protein
LRRPTPDTIAGGLGRRRVRFFLTLFSLLVASFAAPWAGDTPLPYDLTVHVEYGPDGGPEMFREELVRELALSLQRHRCFRSVETEAPEEPDGDDLMLRVYVASVVEEVEWDMSIASRSSPDGQAVAERSHTATIKVDTVADVGTLAEGASVRSKRFKKTGRHRPMVATDARYEARLDAVDDLVRLVRSFACRGSETKWAREIAAARGRLEAPSR